jgi:hypothetical protein
VAKQKSIFPIRDDHHAEISIEQQVLRSLLMNHHFRRTALLVVACLPWLLLMVSSALMATPQADGSTPTSIAQGQFASSADQKALQRAVAKTWAEHGKIVHPDDDPALGFGGLADQFGSAVAIDGATAIVGAWQADHHEYSDDGAAYVFERVQGQWQRQAQLLPSPAQSGGWFGWSVALSGDTALLGAPKSLNSGAVYVFQRVNGEWLQQTVLQSVGAVNGDEFGWSVALTGDLAMIGAPETREGNVSGAGSAYVFTRALDQWTEQARLRASDQEIGASFGWAIHTTGQTALISAPFADDGPHPNAGSVYVFDLVANAWTLARKLNAADPAANDSFGFSVALSENTALIGAAGDDTAGSVDSGSAYVFTRHLGAWNQTAKLTTSDAGSADNFGFALALQADTAVIGAFLDGSAGPETGTVYVFNRSGSQWLQQAALRSADANEGDWLGWSVAISNNTILAGAMRDDTPAGDFAGSVRAFTFAGGAWSELGQLDAGNDVRESYFGQAIALSADTALVAAAPDRGLGEVWVYVRNGTQWQLEARLQSSDIQHFDGFGQALALDGDTALIGASVAAGNSAIRSGAAYVFVRKNGVWTEQAKLAAMDGSLFDYFAQSVSLSGDIALIGARYKNSVGENEGAAYVFRRSAQTWMQEAKLSIQAPQSFDELGAAVALNGDTALVGAPGRDLGLNFDCGSVFVFQRSASTWTQRQQLAGAQSTSGARLGQALAYSNNTALIGAPYDLDANDVAVGSVYVFTESSGDFTEQARLRANEAAVNFATFGWTVALSGDTALIGTDSTQALPDDRKSGVAYQFTRSANTWTQQARLTPADGGLYDGFGIAVSLSVNSAMIGAPAQNSTLTNARDAGAVYLRMRQFQVNASATTGGTITPSIAMVVAGDRHTVSMNGSTTFQTAPIQANCTIEAVFANVSPMIFADGFEN